MKIIKPALNWNGQLIPLNLNKVDGIALHHMAHPTADLWTIDQWHKEKGWLGIGYNYWVGMDGTAYECRGLNEGAGVLGHNGHLISIGFQGDYDEVNKTMPDVQFNTGMELVKYLKILVPTIITVAGHKNWNNSSCPGKYFPLDGMVDETKERSYYFMIKKGDNSAEVAELQKSLNMLGFDLSVDGDFGSATEAAVKNFQSSCGLDIDGIAGPMTLSALEQAVSLLGKQSGHWAQRYYSFLLEKGINIQELRFDDTITRGEVFALAAKMLGFDCIE